MYTYSSLCAFVTDDDGADALSSAAFQNFWVRHCRKLLKTELFASY